MMLTLMGNDGTGKTTLARLIHDELTRNGFKVEYRRGFEYFVVGAFLAIFGKKIEGVRENFLTRGAKKAFVFRLWPYLVWLDFAVALIFTKILRRTYIVVYDRYIYDFLVGWKYFGCSSSLIEKLYLLFPKPDIPLVLDAPAEVTFKRSKFDHKFPLYFYQVQRQRYLDLAKKLSIKTIDTTRALTQTLREIFDEVMYLHDRDFGLPS